MKQKETAQNLKKRIDVASGRVPADLLLINGQVVNVFTEEIYTANIAVVDGVIASVGSMLYEAETIIDLKGAYVSPGLIDGHVHIESAMVTPVEFAKTILPRGTTSVVADPHEIANVSGVKGIEYMLESSEGLPLDVFVMLPSCVPATSFENSGAILKAKELSGLIGHPRVLGLGELMDYPAVIGGDPDIVDKLMMAKGKLVDGHGPAISEKQLNAYVSAGVRTEHECTTPEEMLERLRLGMYIQMREGSAARNLLALLPVINRENMRRVFFCTDDRHPGDILKDGHIDNHIRMSVKEGLSPVMAIKMGSLNAAEAYHLYDRGAIAPGYLADMVILSSLENYQVESVYKEGKLVAEAGKALFDHPVIMKPEVLNTIHLKALEADSFRIPMTSDIVNMIKLNPHSIVTSKVVRKVDVKDGHFAYNDKLDVLKLAVIERHHATGHVGLGLVEGFGLKNGAIASTVAHDSHNLIVIGDTDVHFNMAVEEIKRIGGGLVLVYDGEVVGTLSLPIGGIMSDQSLEVVDEALQTLLEKAYEMGVSRDFDPFMTLAFLALPVIPEIKLTDMGLFDVNEFQFVPLCVE
jgi:adenine deaminase